MSTLIHPIDQLDADGQQYGGKAAALSQLVNQGFRVPRAIVISRQAYESYVDTTGMRGRIMVELSRKPFADMRWEELWDASLRIRNMFARTPIPTNLRDGLHAALEPWLAGPVVVRSSAPGEDAAHQSFAGLHDSFVGIMGVDAVLAHVKLVWASLWSDAALLYRQDMQLDVDTSAMAVVIQDFIAGEVSGVTFCRDPLDVSRQVIEAVHGLNKGLVDGAVEPDRWLIDRSTGDIIEHSSPTRSEGFFLTTSGITHQELNTAQRTTAPLVPDEVHHIIETANHIERLFAAPQDVEWTLKDGDLYLLQSRPITALHTDDDRTQYLGLRRSYENLKQLLKRVEEELLPALQQDITRLETEDSGIL